MHVSISVIMSVYNSEKLLKESIESIINQSFSRFEFIIIDDCSTDASNEIIKTFADKDKRIRLYKNKENIGLTKSLNKALSLSKGKYIARIDADDIALPERLEVQFSFLETHKDLFLLGTWAIEINELGEEGEKMCPKTKFSDIKKILPNRNNFIHSSIMFRNEGAFTYREKFIYAQDYDFYLNLLSKGQKLQNIPQILVKYRVDKNSISFSKHAFQYFFTQKARQFYHEITNNVKESYSNFEPEKEFNKPNKITLEGKIYSALRLYNRKEIRKLCIEYVKKYGFVNKFFIYIFVSFLKEDSYMVLKRRLKL